MTVGLVGSGPAAEAVTTALADVDASVSQTDPDSLGSFDLGVVVAVAGDQTFDRANQAAREAAKPWIGIELGGIGGYPVVEAAISGFSPETVCYECLRGRIQSNVDPDEQPTAAPAVPLQRFAGAVAGRAAAEVQAGEQATIFGRVETIPNGTHSVLPLPDCACGTVPDRSIDRTPADVDVETALARAEQAIDERAGLVQEIGEVESYPAPYYLAQGCDTTGFSDAQAGQEAAGVSDDWNEALMKAVGEGLERYCAGVYRTDRFTEGEPGPLAGAVKPSLFVLPETPEDDASRLWIEGEQLQHGDAAWLPAELVVYPPHERDLRPAITTGLGLGNSGLEALLSGLYEVVERDATMLAWYSSFEPLELTIEDDRYQSLAARARSEGVSVTPLLVTQDVDVPVVATAVHRDGEWPRFAFGSDADLDPAVAARSALAEAVQNWLELRGMGRENAAEASGAIGWYADYPEEIDAFIDADQQVPAGEVGPDPVPEGEAELEEVLERLSETNLDAYAARLTTRDVEQIGFEAVRVLCPGAQPLFFDESYFGERARTVPETLGFEPRLDREHHPFP